MWEVDHLKTMHGGRTLLFAFTKIGTYAVAPPEEMFVLASSNLLTEDDPAKVVWDMWPHGEHGIQAVGAPDDRSVIAEEPHVVPVHADDMLVLLWRTSEGYMGYARSQPGGDFAAPWQTPTFASYLPTWADAYQNASWLKQPRGPLSPKRQPNGLVLMTYYNTAPLGTFASHMTVNDRNNMWLTVGHEVPEGGLRWSQPELVLYERDRSRGHGYPDIVTALGGEVFITETFKSTPHSEAKTHHVPRAMVELLYRQTTINETATEGVVAVLNSPVVPLPAGALPNLFTYPRARYGLSIGLWIDPSKVQAQHTTLVRATSAAAAAASPGVGVVVSYFAANGTVMLDMRDADGRTVRFGTGPVCSGRLLEKGSGPHHVGLLVDGGPKMVSFVVDGKLCDGGPDLKHWANGHHLFDPTFGDIGTNVSAINVDTGIVVGGRCYGRLLYVTEVIGNWRAGTG